MALPDSQRIAELLRAVASVVESSDTFELKELIRELNKRSDTQFSSERPNSKTSQDKLEKGRAVEIIDDLQRSTTREEAASLLGSFKLSRRQLTDLARVRSVHVTKDDNIARIEEKLIEAVVGSRLNSEAIRGTSTRDESFSDINRSIIAQTDSKIRNEILNRRFRFVFNPVLGASKNLTFKTNGAIGEGRNNNEHSWQTNNGRLEILDERGEIYSRFLMLPDGRFQHTNDDDTQSIKGQYFEPINPSR